MNIDLEAPLSQERFGALVGISQQKVSQLLTDGVLGKGDTAQAWLHSYTERLREQAAGRQGEGAGGLDLVQERAALAREQRIGQQIKNAVAKGEYAPVGLLADVLAAASAGVVDRFDQLEGALRKACPDLQDAARTVIQATIASARNEWIRATAALVEQRLDELTVDEDDSEGGELELLEDDGA